MPDRSSFFTLHLAAEAATVASKLTIYLAGFMHLTLSFDGWSSKENDKIYTVHITTPLRCSFLIDGLVLTGLSASGDVLFNYLSDVSNIYILLYWS